MNPNSEIDCLPSSDATAMLDGNIADVVPLQNLSMTANLNDMKQMKKRKVPEEMHIDLTEEATKETPEKNDMKLQPKPKEMRAASAKNRHSVPRTVGASKSITSKKVNRAGVQKKTSLTKHKQQNLSAKGLELLNDTVHNDDDQADGSSQVPKPNFSKIRGWARLWYLREMDIKKAEFLEFFKNHTGETEDLSTSVDQSLKNWRCHWRRQMWVSDALLDHVHSSVLAYNETKSPTEPSYDYLSDPERSGFWLHPTRFTREIATTILDPLSPSLDIDAFLSHDQWSHYFQCLYTIACQSIWKHQFQPATTSGGAGTPDKRYISMRIYQNLAAAPNAFFPDRPSVIDLPKANTKAKATKAKQKKKAEPEDLLRELGFVLPEHVKWD